MNYYTNLAKETVENFINNHKIIKPPKDLPTEFFNNQAGVFVSLHLKNGDLRGCIGTFLPTKKNIAEEIIANAISAACHDPRFSKVSGKELTDLVYNVDILTKPEPIKNIKELDPKKYGILVKMNDYRSGLLLPDLEGVNTVDEQLSIVCLKAGISWPSEQPMIYKFSVRRYK